MLRDNDVNVQAWNHRLRISFFEVIRPLLGEVGAADGTLANSHLLHIQQEANHLEMDSSHQNVLNTVGVERLASCWL
jgi:hypothetical protein